MVNRRLDFFLVYEVGQIITAGVDLGKNFVSHLRYYECTIILITFLNDS